MYSNNMQYLCVCTLFARLPIQSVTRSPYLRIAVAIQRGNTAAILHGL